MSNRSDQYLCVAVENELSLGDVLLPEPLGPLPNCAR